MEQDLFAKEIKLAALTTRIAAPGISDDEFPAVVELQRRLKESGYLEIVQGIRRQEKEFGMPYSQTLEFYSQIKKQSEKLKAEVAEEQEHLAKLRMRTKEASRRTQENEEAADKARMEREKEETDLAVLRERAEGEKRRLALELEKAREETRIDLDEIPMAGKIKIEVESRGLSLEQVLNLCWEFPNGEKDCKRLAQAIDRSGSLCQDIAALEKHEGELETKLAELKQGCQEQQQILSQLKGEVAFEAEVHRFYRRFKPLERLIEYLPTWEGIAFKKCLMCGARFWAERAQAKRWFQRDYDTCPCCGFGSVTYDSQAYSIVGWAPDSRIVGKILLGE